ncbi:MAG: PDZ domain-containing protein [Proteobacteria bacterium]|nr:PDZ domain-containing protein [Pseudomonadota bacterium]MDA1302020.1 PDZ domain-containing protein [Pseudomonadota bacterium]
MNRHRIVAWLTQWLTAAMLLIPAAGLSAEVKLEIREDLVYLDAEYVSLISVLEALAEKAGIRLESEVPLTQPITLRLNGVSVQRALQRLLSRESYTLAFQQTETDIRVKGVDIFRKLADMKESDFATIETVVYDPESMPESVPESSDSLPEGAPPVASDGPSIQNYDQASLNSALENDYLADELDIDDGDQMSDSPLPRPTGDRSPDPRLLGGQSSGVRITRVAASSIFTDFGLKSGDVITDVNGHKVGSSQEFVQALRTASSSQSIRISRKDENGVFNPIYIQVQPQSPEP